ncbi:MULTISPECIES: hypothetical protein [Stenotrophomonas]|uniref:hypothetical protein n=1 Tax=Stenotrophomonas TaxID=40323 RepID=UPI001E63255C|nr:MULTISPECIES: hypothetical protein [Stenotrophomonas]MCA7024793.1 hypothetical protein [Stenotrophomonas acidaminiphila]MCE4074449.1 hypothetical protein [Stenotrophomonas acidaminiphila]
MVILMVLCAVVIAGLRPGGLMIFDNPGSAADWVAALGTWMIGFGATKFAANDYQLKLHERRQLLYKDNIKALTTVGAKLSAVRRWNKTVEMMGEYFSNFQRSGGRPGLLTDNLISVVNSLGDTPWTAQDEVDFPRSLRERLMVSRLRSQVACDLARDLLDICQNGGGESFIILTHIERIEELGELLCDVVSPLPEMLRALSETRAQLDKTKSRIAMKLKQEEDELLDG